MAFAVRSAKASQIAAAIGGDLAYGSLQPREGEIATGPALQRARQQETRGIALASEALDLRPARIAEADQLRRLVESFASRVVECCTEAGITPDASANEQLAMPAGDQQEEVGKVDVIRQTRCQRVTFEMVDGEKRFSGGPGETFRHHRADNQTPDQTGSGGGGHPVDLGKRYPSLGERAHDDRVKVLEMGARGDFRDDPAIGRVLRKLRLDQVGSDPRGPRLRGNDSSGCFVAACFDAEDDHGRESRNLAGQASACPAAAQCQPGGGDLVGLERLVGRSVDF
jgi:hypothetical protein